MLGWIEREEVDSGEREGVTTSECERLKALEREVKELRCANEILKLASAFFDLAELDRRCAGGYPCVRFLGMPQPWQGT